VHHLNVSVQVQGQWPNFDSAEAYRSAYLAFSRRHCVASCTDHEAAHAFEPVQDGRIYVEKINEPFLYQLKGHAPCGRKICDHD
jgi:hypothetical protein